MSELKPRLPAWVIRDLEKALARAKFEGADFGMPYDVVSFVQGPRARDANLDINMLIHNETRPYRESWLVPVIENLIAYAKGETYVVNDR